MSNPLLETAERIVETVGKDIEHFKPVQDLATKLNVKPGHVVLVGFVVMFLFVLTGIFSELVTSIFGFAYPAYMSFKALEHEATAEKTRTQWLTYWVVFSMLLFFDLTLGWLVSIIPFYYVAKLLFLMWLFYPKSNGAEVVYNKFIRGFLKSHEKQIDDELEEIEKVVEETEKKLKPQ